jgi:hypothetical protein
MAKANRQSGAKAPGSTSGSESGNPTAVDPAAPISPLPTSAGGPAKRKESFPSRRAATPSELADAVASRGKLQALREYGLSDSAMSRTVRLPIEAIEYALREAPAPAVEAPAPSAVPPGAMMSQAPPRYEDARLESPLDDYREERVAADPLGDEPADPLAGPAIPPADAGVVLYRCLKGAGVPDARARFVGRRWRHRPANDVAGLRSLLSECAVPTQIASMVVSSYVEESGIGPIDGEHLTGGFDAPTDSSGANARLRRQLQEDLEHRLLLARIRSIEREAPLAQGSATSPELEALRAANAGLLEEKRGREMRDSFQAMLSPLAASIEELKRTSVGPSSLDQVAVDEARRQVIMRDRAQGELFSALSKKVQESGSLQQLSKAAIGSVAPEVRAAAIDLARSTRSGWKTTVETPAALPPAIDASGGDLEAAALLLAKIRGTP